MANIIQEAIEQLRDTEKMSDSMQSLIHRLEEKDRELGNDASDEARVQAVLSCLSSKLGIRMDEAYQNEDFLERASAKVRDVFKKEKWQYNEENPEQDMKVFELGFMIEDCNLRMKVFIESEPKVCRVEAILPITAGSVYDYVLCREMAKENYPRRFGALHYDARDGELSFRYSYLIDKYFDPDDFRTVFLSVAGSAVDGYYLLSRYAVGSFDRQEISRILDRVNRIICQFEKN